MFRLVVLSALVAVAIAAPSHLHAVDHHERYDVNGSPIYTYADDSAHVHNAVDLHDVHYDDAQLYEDNAHLYTNSHGPVIEESFQHHLVPEAVAVHKLQQVHHEAPIVDDSHYASALAHQIQHENAHQREAHQLHNLQQVHHATPVIVDDSHYAAAVHNIQHEAPVVDDSQYRAALAREAHQLHQIQHENEQQRHNIHHQAPVVVDDSHYAHEDVHHVPQIAVHDIHQVHHESPVLVDNSQYAAALAHEDAHYAHENIHQAHTLPASTQHLSAVDIAAHNVHQPALHSLQYNAAPLAAVHAVDDVHNIHLVAPVPLVAPSVHSESTSSVQHSVSAPGYHVASSHSVHEVKETPAVVGHAVHGIHGVHASLPVAVSHSARTDVHKTASVVAHPVVGHLVNNHGVHGIHRVQAW